MWKRTFVLRKNSAIRVKILIEENLTAHFWEINWKKISSDAYPLINGTK